MLLACDAKSAGAQASPVLIKLSRHGSFSSLDLGTTADCQGAISTVRGKLISRAIGLAVEAEPPHVHRSGRVDHPLVAGSGVSACGEARAGSVYLYQAAVDQEPYRA